MPAGDRISMALAQWGYWIGAPRNWHGTCGSHGLEVSIFLMMVRCCSLEARVSGQTISAGETTIIGLMLGNGIRTSTSFTLNSVGQTTLKHVVNVP